MIPENIKAEDILRAIEEAERLGIIPHGRDSEKYDLEYNGKLYPPKYIISLANKYANGKELDHSEFGGGEESNNFLESLGFNIMGKQKVSEKEYESITNISQTKNPLSFFGLQTFLLKEMEMRANYQPIMIKTLLLSGGKLTRDKIAEKIKELNSEKEDQDFKNIPVYDVLEKRGVVRKYDNEFVLNIIELTPEQSNQLIALCDWKILTLPLQFEELIEAFDKNKSLFEPERITLEEGEKLRLSFVSDFSMDRILEMKLDEYIAGKHDPQSDEVNKSTFCYRLERELGILSGIGGTTPLKFGIYFNGKIQNYDYNKKKYDSHEKAFDAIKSEIYTILQAGKQFKEDKNWNNLSEVLERDYNIYSQVRSKILSVYYPEDFIQIHSLKYLQVILEAFGKPTIDVKHKLFLTQARLLEVKNSHPVMKEWNNEDFSHFVWKAVIERKTNTRESDEEYKSSSPKVSLWVVRAGSRGEQENDALERNVVTIAWNQLPDLSSVNDKESLRQLYFASDPNAKEMAVANMVGSIWRFIKEIKKGDLVALPLLSQNSKSIAIGKVEGDYNYKELTPDIKHIRPVIWLSKNISKSEFGENIIKQLQIPMTVYQIKVDDIINTVKKVLQKSGINDIDIGKTDDEKSQRDNKVPTIFVTGYDNENLSKSKELGILGWKYNSRLLSTYDLVFVFNKSNLNVESCFEMRSKSPNTVLIWPDELKSNQLIYKNRWEARLRNDNLGISLDTINKMEPFNRESFQLKTRDPFPMPLNSPACGNKYAELCNFLLNKINYIMPSQASEENAIANKSEVKSWHSLTTQDIDEIVSFVLQGDKEKEKHLAILPETVKRIIIHLISSKHVILVGPPGTGKTDLARRLLRELSKTIIGKSDSVEAVASYEWGRYEVIGGNSLKTNMFHLGCITRAIKEQKLLLIDEFNRADMNKAFGEMFLAVDHGTIQLREDENPVDMSLFNNLKHNITIPPEFRMICTMNDYDKSLLNELSYGLLRRFASIEIDTPTSKDEEMSVVMERMTSSNTPNSFNQSITDEVIKTVTPQIDKFLDFMFEVRNKRKLGVSTSIDVAKYIVIGYALSSKRDRSEGDNIQWKLLNQSLVDYVLPQLDRIDLSTLIHIRNGANKQFRNDKTLVPEDIKIGFISKIEKMIADLEYMNRLFTSTEEE